MMSDWLVRPYPHGRLRAQEFLDRKAVAIGWPAIGDARTRSDEELTELLEQQYPNLDAKRIAKDVDCIHKFTHDMKAGDLVLVVPKNPDFNGYVLLAEILGDYEYDPSLASNSEGYPHLRSVRWVRPRIARSQLPEGLGSVLGRRALTLALLEDGVLSEHARKMGWIG